MQNAQQMIQQLQAQALQLKGEVYDAQQQIRQLEQVCQYLTGNIAQMVEVDPERVQDPAAYVEALQAAFANGAECDSSSKE
ncbi:tail fiber chaperone [Vibrio phage EniLVp02]